MTPLLRMWSPVAERSSSLRDDLPTSPPTRECHDGIHFGHIGLRTLRMRPRPPQARSKPPERPPPRQGAPPTAPRMPSPPAIPAPPRRKPRTLKPRPKRRRRLRRRLRRSPMRTRRPRPPRWRISPRTTRPRQPMRLPGRRPRPNGPATNWAWAPACPMRSLRVRPRGWRWGPSTSSERCGRSGPPGRRIAPHPWWLQKKEARLGLSRSGLRRVDSARQACGCGMAPAAPDVDRLAEPLS